MQSDRRPKSMIVTNNSTAQPIRQTAAVVAVPRLAEAASPSLSPPAPIRIGQKTVQVESKRYVVS